MTATNSLALLRKEAATCSACPLWAHATQTVFGEGMPEAHLMLVGEQPGDREDLAGKPFVGPAGALLEQALKECGIARAEVYITNAVKHFKWELRGKRRMHKTPAQKEIDACHPWLERELAVVKPRLVIALGATALRSLLGHTMPIQENRGKLLRLADDTPLVVTVHPSFLLRVPREFKADAYQEFIGDLMLAKRTLSSIGHPR